MRNSWKKIIVLLLVSLVIYTSTGVYASFPDVQEDASYLKSIERLASLGIITGNEKGEYRPNDMLTREQFAKVIVQVANLEDKVNEVKSGSSFPDISPERWSSDYIEVAVDSGYINGKLDGKFHPDENITYAEACTAMVKMLGYSTNDLTGIWPDNYINKAEETGISDGVDLSSHDALPRWALAVMLDNLMNTPIKTNQQLTLAEANELYTDCIVLETAKTSTVVAENEVLTDKGVFTISPEAIEDIQLSLGKKSRLEIDDGIIIRTYDNLSITKEISVEGISGTTVIYSAEGGVESFTLPSTAQYYYKGKPLNYEELEDKLDLYSSIILNMNESGTGYEYGVIYDPIYSEPVIANNNNISDEAIGNIVFNEGIRIERNGKFIESTEIKDNDVIYQVSDIWQSNKYIYVVDNKVQGEIAAFLPNKISPKSIEVNNIVYTFSPDMDYEGIIKQGDFEVDDSVTLLLGSNGKVVDILTGYHEIYIDCIIFETEKTSDSLSSNEILTDKGVFYISENLGETSDFKLGKKYRLGIADDFIKSIYEELSITKNISVEEFSGTTITYRDEDIVKSYSLSSKTQYYYKGKSISNDEIPNILSVYSSIVLNVNASGTGYEYGVIYDPIYSEPLIAKNIDLASQMFYNNKSGEEVKIDRNGELIRASEIEDKDVVYQVSDIWENNKYLHVIDKKIDGEITAFSPNKISPKSVEIDGVVYQLSSDMDFGKITKPGMYEAQDSVTLLLGYDDKVVDIYLNSDEDNYDFALVINDYTEISTSIEEYGKEKFYVKLLHIDGTTEIYERKDDDNNYEGQLVNYEIIESEDEDPDGVILTELEYLPSKSYMIDKEEKMLDQAYFSDNVKIFNLVYNIYGADSNAYLMNVSDLPNGTIEPDKIKYINKVGDFGDINIMLVEDILDESYQLGLVTKTITSYSPQLGNTYTHTVLIDGAEYITNHHVDGMSTGDVVEVRLLGNKIMHVEEIKSKWVESATIEAIDSNRIKIKDDIYSFSDDVAIYFKNSDGEYEQKGTSDLVPGQSYGRISIYLDKATIYGGKVEVIIVRY